MIIFRIHTDTADTCTPINATSVMVLIVILIFIRKKSSFLIHNLNQKQQWKREIRNMDPSKASIRATSISQVVSY